MRCPSCKKTINLSNPKMISSESKITCPNCHRSITIQGSVKSDVDKSIQQAISGHRSK